MNLLQRTYELINKSSLKRDEIARGAGVGVDWFKKFVARGIPEPGVKKVQAVHDFLSRGADQSCNHAA